MSMRISTLVIASLLVATVAHADVGPGPHAQRQPPPLPPSSIASPAKFAADAKAKGFQFALPAGFTPAPLVANRDMLYEFAMRDPAKKYEVRFALRTISQEDLKHYKDYVAKKLPAGTVVTDPNKRYQAELMAISMNVGQIGLQQANAMPPEVAKTYGADVGQGVALIGPKSEFAKGWGKLMVVQISKRDVGQGYIFLLFNEPADVPADALDGAILHSLTFASSAK